MELELLQPADDKVTGTDGTKRGLSLLPSLLLFPSEKKTLTLTFSGYIVARAAPERKKNKTRFLRDKLLPALGVCMA